MVFRATISIRKGGGLPGVWVKSLSGSSGLKSGENTGRGGDICVVAFVRGVQNIWGLGRAIFG